MSITSSVDTKRRAKELEKAANFLFFEMREAYTQTHVLCTEDEIDKSLRYPYPALILMGHCTSCEPCRSRVQKNIEDKYHDHLFASGMAESWHEQDEENRKGYTEAKKAFEILCKALP